MTQVEAKTTGTEEAKIFRTDIINNADVEIEKIKADLGKYEADITMKMQNWRLEQELKHKKFVRVTDAIEKVMVVGIVGGIYGYIKKEAIELAKHKAEYGQ